MESQRSTGTVGTDDYLDDEGMTERAVIVIRRVTDKLTGTSMHLAVTLTPALVVSPPTTHVLITLTLTLTRCH